MVAQMLKISTQRDASSVLSNAKKKQLITKLRVLDCLLAALGTKLRSRVNASWGKLQIGGIFYSKNDTPILSLVPKSRVGDPGYEL
ncbi:hypothetical protein PoB_001071800 [Plakobranchus ocellatus]|uniref:Uncharacterized protein n=1 Tax=Plakobranchus ocellatus TaxID=259542 RepID=A0AAV3YNS1_9GAST|nr:hypothetical protein PoB_001071800 [Plakobranchus ocellatus]